jgi:oligoendopeptidase F
VIVTVSVLPPSPAAFAKASWDDVAPYFDELAARPINHSTIEAWLRAWSALEELVTEAAARAMIAYTIDTSDAEKEADHLRFSTEVLPRMEERSVELARRLVDSGYSTSGLMTTLDRFRTQIEIFREENVPIFAELEEHSARYQRITGSITVEWDGVERPLPQLQPFLKSPDRATRERAFRAASQT